MNLLEDNSKLDSHGFKEPDNIMMSMATYGTIEREGQEQTWAWKSENANAGPPSNTLNLCTITSNIAMLLMLITIGGKLQSAWNGLGLQSGGFIESLHPSLQQLRSMLSRFGSTFSTIRTWEHSLFERNSLTNSSIIP